MKIQAPHPYALLAMPPSGEAMFVRDNRDRIWFIKFLPLYQQRDATLDEVDTAVIKHGWERIDLEFSSWKSLDEYRLHRAGD